MFKNTSEFFFLELKKDYYGKDAINDDIAMTLNNIGVVLAGQKKRKEALEKYNQALEMFKALYGPIAKNGHIAMSFYNIGQIKCAMGQFHQAGTYLREALALRRHIYGHVAMSSLHKL